MSSFEYKKLSIDELVSIINTELKNGNNLTKIARELFSVNESSIRKKLNKVGYRRVNDQFILVDTIKEDDNDKTEVREEIKQDTKPIESTSENKGSLIIPNNLKVNLIELAKDYERIMNVVKMVEESEYDKMSYSKYDKVSYSEYDNEINIRLPLETVKDFRATTRVNNVIWSQFDDFCKENKEFTKRDLVSMALLEYMQKYKK